MAPESRVQTEGNLAPDPAQQAATPLPEPRPRRKAPEERRPLPERGVIVPFRRALWRRPWVSALLGATVGGTLGYNIYRYFFLCDDAFISYRYSRHLVDGLGLVWNPGEAVEGYTNFLWVMITAAGMALRIEPEVLTPTLGIVSGIVLLGLVAALAARRDGWTDPVIWLAPAALALSRSYTAWCTGGLETQFFSLLAFAGLFLLIRERERHSVWPWMSSLCLAAATLTRPEGGIFMFCAGVCFLGDVAMGRRKFNSLVVWTLPWIAIVGAHFLWRHSYYGFWLPNTFYAKVNGLWWEQSARYLGLFLSEYKVHWFAPLLALAIVVRRDFTSILLGLSATVYSAYIIYIGGGHIGYRLLVPMLPMVYLLIADGMRVIARAPRLRPAPAWAAAALSVALLGLTHWGSLHPADKLGSGGVGDTFGATKYGLIRIEQGKELRKLVDRGILPADLRFETGAAGALPYYTGWYVLDQLGLNDASIAHRPVTHRGSIAHEKQATLADTREREIAVKSLGHRVLHRTDRAGLAQALRRASARAAHFNRQARTPEERLRVKCLEVEPGAALVFGTNLDEARFQQILGHLPPCA